LVCLLHLTFLSSLGGFNVKRPIRRGGNPADFCDHDQAFTIYDVDNDRWFKVDITYLLDGSARYDPLTGSPIGIESSTVVNRANTIEYDGEDYNDRYGELLFLAHRELTQ